MKESVSSVVSSYEIFEDDPKFKAGVAVKKLLMTARPSIDKSVHISSQSVLQNQFSSTPMNKNDMQDGIMRASQQAFHLAQRRQTYEHNQTKSVLSLAVNGDLFGS